MTCGIYSYRDLIVWQKAIELVDNIYDLTEMFPNDQKYRLVDQMQRAVVSIPSNIAEGSRRRTSKDFNHYLRISYSSGAELETQLEISKRRSYGSKDKLQQASNLLDEIMRMLNKMIQNITK
ncbi:MAG: four helix bundle protein [Candidatus Peribacteraceae bacterium]|nr:four helix bundle protein [Candidatus Peribacteraceae bacterium]HCI03769.1 four helix bundle protein [Candidatus Peribacteria bacterium]